MAEEPSRVVHLRLRNNTILACHKLMELQKGEMPDIPMSTMLVDVLVSLADKLVASGKIPNIPDAYASDLLDAIYKDDPINGEPEAELEEPDMMDDFVLDVEVADSDIKENLSLHSIPLDKEFQKRSPDEQQEVEEEIVYPEEPPWYDGDNERYNALRLKSPKDMLIEAAEDNNHLQRAIEIVYNTIPLDMWGGPKAQALIAEVMPTVIHYLGPMSITEENPDAT